MIDRGGDFTCASIVVRFTATSPFQPTNIENSSTPNPRASKQTTFERYLGHAQRKSDTPGTTERTREYYRQDSDAI